MGRIEDHWNCELCSSKVDGAAMWTWELFWRRSWGCAGLGPRREESSWSFIASVPSSSSSVKSSKLKRGLSSSNWNSSS